MATRSRNTSNRAPMAAPLDIRLMNAVATGVFGLAALVLLALAITWATRAPLFTLRATTTSNFLSSVASPVGLAQHSRPHDGLMGP